MSTAWHVLLTVLGWILTGYTVILGVIFACLLIMALAALLGRGSRSERMPTDREWGRVLTAWTRESEGRNERGIT